MEEIIHSIQDFNLLKSKIEIIIDNYWTVFHFKEESIGFSIFILEEFYGLQEDEIEDSLTDSIFVTRQWTYSNNEHSPHDRWIDAIIVNEEEKTVDIFNFKYKQNFKDVGKYFESTEIDKVMSFLRNLFERNDKAFINSNPRIKNKIWEIEFLQDKKYINFKFKIHFVANIYNWFSEDETIRLKCEIERYQWSVEYDFMLLPTIVNKLSRPIRNINWRFRAINDRYFEKSWYGYKALIAEVKWEDIVRLTLENEELRGNCEATIFDIANNNINENIFDDNVRIYLTQSKSTINQWIKRTALSADESLRFFFYNNWITITCNKIIQDPRVSAPNITLEWLQVVNWWQTIHSLKEALDEDPENFKEVSVLCRIYETSDINFKSKIAEYTNNQNAVSDRDIKSIDIYQIKLEEELKTKWFFYERKKNQYISEQKIKRIDSEKLWQAMLAFYEELPMEAKNKKKVIFTDKYDQIFNSDLTADKALRAINIYLFVEKKKRELKDEKKYLGHASYYILFFLKKITWEWKNQNEYEKNYPIALEYIEQIIKKETEKLGDEYFDAVLFKSNRPKSYLSELWL